MLGFQLIVMMMQRFDELSAVVREVHLLALASLTLAVILLIAPAAIHRIGFGGQDDRRFHAIGSRLIGLEIAPLALAISCDLFSAFLQLFQSDLAALFAAAGGLILLSGLWHVFPLVLRQRFAQVKGGA